MTGISLNTFGIYKWHHLNRHMQIFSYKSHVSVKYWSGVLCLTKWGCGVLLTAAYWNQEAHLSRHRQSESRLFFFCKTTDTHTHSYIPNIRTLSLQFDFPFSSGTLLFSCFSPSCSVFHLKTRRSNRLGFFFSLFFPPLLLCTTHVLCRFPNL